MGVMGVMGIRTVGSVCCGTFDLHAGSPLDVFRCVLSPLAKSHVSSPLAPQPSIMVRYLFFNLFYTWACDECVGKVGVCDNCEEWGVTYGENGAWELPCVLVKGEQGRDVDWWRRIQKE